MLENVEILNPTNLLEKIRKEEILTVVIDEGLKNRGAFGWIIAKQKEKLAKCR